MCSPSSGALLISGVKLENFIGQRAPQAFVEQANATEGVWRGKSGEGELVRAGYARSRLAGWWIWVSVEESAVQAALRYGVLTLAGLGVSLAVLGMFVAYIFGGRLARSVGSCTKVSATRSIMLRVAVGRIGCQVSGDGDYGIRSSLPWAMGYPHGTLPTPPGVKVQPTPIYETVTMCLIAYLLWWLRDRVRPGVVFALYLVLSGFCVWAAIGLHWLFWIPFVALSLVELEIVTFFRDPERTIPPELDAFMRRVRQALERFE